jgi:uncharacterized protein YkwD
MRRLLRLACAATLAGVPVVGIAAPSEMVSGAAASAAVVDSVRLNGFEAQLAQRINAARAHAGLRPLVVTPGTTDVARRWSWHLADAQALSHNPSLVHDLAHAGSADWTDIAENVGEGPSNDPGALFDAYMHSPPHRANILDPHARYLGVGVVERAGLAWNTLDFTDAYAGYRLTRVPAAGMRMDARAVTSTEDVAMLERPDERFAAHAHGALAASPVRFSGPTDRNDYAVTVVRPTRSGRGQAALIMRDALDLRAGNVVSVQVAAVTPTGRRVPVTLAVQQAFGGGTTLGSVPVGAPRWVSFTVPASAAGFRNTLRVSVAAHGVRQAGGQVRLKVYDVRVAS